MTTWRNTQKVMEPPVGAGVGDRAKVFLSTRLETGALPTPQPTHPLSTPTPVITEHRRHPWAGQGHILNSHLPRPGPGWDDIYLRRTSLRSKEGLPGKLLVDTKQGSVPCPALSWLLQPGAGRGGSQPQHREGTGSAWAEIQPFSPFCSSGKSSALRHL